MKQVSILFGLLNVHNHPLEIVNIWVHIIASGIFFVLFCYNWHYFPRRTISFRDKIMIGIYLFAVVLSFSCSVIFHTAKDARSEHGNFFILDLSGILILAYSASITVYYYGLQRAKNPWIKRSYIISMAIMNILAIICLSQLDKPTLKQAKYYVTIQFVVICMEVLLQWHVLFYFNNWGYLKEAGIAYYLSAMVCIFLGFLLYIAKIPERFMPGDLFDMYLHSHQWWHVLSSICAYLHYLFILGLVEASYSDK